MVSKRGRTSKDNAIKSTKRRKINKPAAKHAEAPRELVSVDALDWKEVALPDILNDAEGFYGLEEIEGVDVERDLDGSGELKFKVAITSLFHLACARCSGLTPFYYIRLRARISRSAPMTILR